MGGALALYACPPPDSQPHITEIYRHSLKPIIDELDKCLAYRTASRSVLSLHNWINIISTELSIIELIEQKIDTKCM